MIQEIPFYPYLTEEEKELLQRTIWPATYRKGQVVHRHGDSCVGMIFVRKGRLAFSILSEEGREITVFEAEKGDSCILSAACIFQGMDQDSHIMAEIPSEVFIIPAMDLSRLMNQNRDVERLVYKQAVHQYSSVLKTMQKIVFFSLEKRLASYLQDEITRRKSPSFSATHVQIARHIGSSREVVTRTLNQFASRGIVSLGRGIVTVTNPDALLEILEPV